MKKIIYFVVLSAFFSFLSFSLFTSHAYAFTDSLTDEMRTTDKCIFDILDDRKPKSEKTVHWKNKFTGVKGNTHCNISAITTLLNRRLASDNKEETFSIKTVLESFGCKDLEYIGESNTHQFWYWSDQTESTGNWADKKNGQPRVYSNGSTDYSITRVSGDTVRREAGSSKNITAYFAKLLHEHPEGLAVHFKYNNGNSIHAVVIYKYEYVNGEYILYANDNVGNQSGEFFKVDIGQRKVKNISQMYSGLNFIVYINGESKLLQESKMDVTRKVPEENAEFYHIIKGNGTLKEFPYATANQKGEKLTANVPISALEEKDILKLKAIVANSYEQGDGQHVWARVTRLGKDNEICYAFYNNLEYLYKKVAECYFPIICEQDDIKILPFADAKNKEEKTKGSKLYVVAQYKNKYDNTWFGVAKEDHGVQIGFVNINNIKFDQNASQLEVVDYEGKVPNGKWEEWSKKNKIGGKIKSKITIDEIRIEIVDQTTNKVVFYESCYPNIYDVEINLNSQVKGKNISEKITAKINSKDLPEGRYIYRVQVSCGYMDNTGCFTLLARENLIESKFTKGNPPEIEEKPQEEEQKPSTVEKIIDWLKDAFSFTLIVQAQGLPEDELKKATITWLNEDGSVFDTTTAKLGTLPKHDPPVKANTAGKTYAFSGWTPSITTVYGPATYKAVFAETANSYTITWKNEDGTVIDTTTAEYGTVPTHADAVKASTAELGYIFTGWEPNVVAVTGNAEYKATFTSYTNWHGVIWQNANGIVLKTDVVNYGEMPAYTGETPTIPDTDGYTYTFKGWTPAISPVTGDITYTAEYDAVAKEPSSSYYTYSGSGQNYVKDSGEDKQFSVKRSDDDDKTFSLFRGIQTDGVDVDASNYEASKGSVVIKLKASYLETLAVGDHVLTVLFEDGKDDIPFTVSTATPTITPTVAPDVTPTVEPTGKPINPASFNDVAVPSDSFTFKKVWQGDSEKSIDFTLYKADGTVYHHGFDKKVVSNREWRYNAWFSSPAACYVIEKPIPGYQTKYVNVGVYAQITDRCCDGGTIINKKIPKTGDTADLALWAGLMLVGIAGLTTLVLVKKCRKAEK